ncbi:MAG: Holliday junction branch migration protein RuvA [Ruminococcaceae bacterium]|nr:Holliday junction branch migration protein RuvA [Oscillospiraceae bacterium]
MFEYLKGPVALLGTDYAVIDINGVGFKIFTSYSSIGQVAIGEITTFYTFMSVKEDDISLYGFVSREELNAFNMLLSVNGVGPKMAIGILSSMSSYDFCVSVSSGDYKMLCKVKGVGPKLAQRIVLELKDKIKKDLAVDTAESSVIIQKSVNTDVTNDAVEALMYLGHTAQSAKEAVGNVYKDGMGLEELIKEALKSTV